MSAIHCFLLLLGFIGSKLPLCSTPFSSLYPNNFYEENRCDILEHAMDGLNDVALAQLHPIVERLHLVYLSLLLILAI